MSFLEKIFPKELTVNEAINRSRTEENAVIVDVRPKEDFKKSHVSGSVNVPFDHLDLINNRVKDKTTTLYVVGGYGSEPRKAAKELRKLGYEKTIVSGRMEEHYGPMKKSL